MPTFLTTSRWVIQVTLPGTFDLVSGSISIRKVLRLDRLAECPDRGAKRLRRILDDLVAVPQGIASILQRLAGLIDGGHLAAGVEAGLRIEN